MKKRSFFWGLTGLSAAVLLGGAASLYQATETRLWIDRAAGLSISVPTVSDEDDMTLGYFVEKDRTERHPLAFSRATGDGDWFFEQTVAMTVCVLEAGPGIGNQVRSLLSVAVNEGAAKSREVCESLSYQGNHTTQRVFHSARNVETAAGRMILCEVGFSDNGQEEMKRARQLYGLMAVGSTAYGLSCAVIAEDEETIMRHWDERRSELHRIFGSLAYQPASR